MGVDAGDFDNDGDEDLFITNCTAEGRTPSMSTTGAGTFEDASAASGLGPASLPTPASAPPGSTSTTTAGSTCSPSTAAVHAIEAQARADDPFPLQQPNQLFRNLRQRPVRGRDRARAGAVFATLRGRPRRGVRRHRQRRRHRRRGRQRRRPAAAAREQHRQPEALARAAAGRQSAPRLRGRGAAPDAAGHARRAGRIVRARACRRCWRARPLDGSYASANDPRVLVGLGGRRRAPRVRVHWPDGKTEEWPDVPIDRWTTLTEGSSRQ